MCCAETTRRPSELAEPVLEQLVGAVEIGPQAPERAGAVPARERLLARGAEQLPVNADDQPRGDACVALVDVELRLDRAGERLREPGHHLELLRLQRGRLLDDPREER